MTVNELDVEVEFQDNVLHVDVAGEIDFTYADKEKLDGLIPITNAQINALFS